MLTQKLPDILITKGTPEKPNPNGLAGEWFCSQRYDTGVQPLGTTNRPGIGRSDEMKTLGNWEIDPLVICDIAFEHEFPQLCRITRGYPSNPLILY